MCFHSAENKDWMRPVFVPCLCVCFPITTNIKEVFLFDTAGYTSAGYTSTCSSVTMFEHDTMCHMYDSWQISVWLCGCMLAPALWRPCLSLFNDGIVFWVCDRNSGTRTAGGRVFLQPCYVCFFNPRLDSWCWPEQAVCRHFLYTKAIYVLYQCRLKLNSICIGMIPLQKHFTYHSAKETWEKSAVRYRKKHIWRHR